MSSFVASCTVNVSSDDFTIKMASVRTLSLERPTDMYVDLGMEQASSSIEQGFGLSDTRETLKRSPVPRLSSVSVVMTKYLQLSLLPSVLRII